MSGSRWVALAATASVITASHPASAQTWTDWGEAEIRSLAAAENGRVTEVEIPGDGALHVYATFDDWLNVLFIGDECTSGTGKPRCTTLAFNALFEVDDAVRSEVLQDDLSFRYVADMADGEDFVIHRQVELTGGVGLPNIRSQLNGFIAVSELVAEAVWPPKESQMDNSGGKPGQPPP